MYEHPDPPLRSIFNLIKCIAGKDFKPIQQKAELFIKKLFDSGQFINDLLVEEEYNYELNTTKDLVAICLPISRVSAEDPFTSNSCPILWQGINSYLNDRLKTVSFDKVDTSESEVEIFSNLLHIFLLGEAKERCYGCNCS